MTRIVCTALQLSPQLANSLLPSVLPSFLSFAARSGSSHLTVAFTRAKVKGRLLSFYLLVFVLESSNFFRALVVLYISKW